MFATYRKIVWLQVDEIDNAVRPVKYAHVFVMIYFVAVVLSALKGACSCCSGCHIAVWSFM